MRIEVTQEDIAEGEPNSCGLCPVSLGVSRAAQRGDCLVGSDHVTFTDCLDKDYRLPAEAVHFIADFDAGRPVAPFSFELEIQETGV